MDCNFKIIRSFPDNCHNLRVFLDDFVGSIHRTEKIPILNLPPISTDIPYDTNDVVLEVMLLSMKKSRRVKGIGRFLRDSNVNKTRRRLKVKYRLLLSK